MEVSESVFRDPKELEALKAKVKPETYLKALYAKIFEKEKELESISFANQEKKRQLDIGLVFSSAEIKRQLDEVESELIIKRQERVELEKPFNDRSKELDERSLKLDERSKSLDDATQAVFERERAAEGKLEAVQDLADSLGKTRVRLSVKEKTLEGREKILKEKETRQLVSIQNWNEEEARRNDGLQSRAYSIELRELNVQGKEENLIRREKELLDGYIRLEDQRGTLARAWDELERKRKQYG